MTRHRGTVEIGLNEFGSGSYTATCSCGWRSFVLDEHEAAAAVFLYHREAKTRLVSTRGSIRRRLRAIVESTGRKWDGGVIADPVRHHMRVQFAAGRITLEEYDRRLQGFNERESGDR